MKRRKQLMSKNKNVLAIGGRHVKNDSKRQTINADLPSHLRASPFVGKDNNMLSLEDKTSPQRRRKQSKSKLASIGPSRQLVEYDIDDTDDVMKQMI